MYEALKSAHSGLRWVALILILWAIYNAFTSKEFNKREKLVNLFSMVSLHTQLVLGILLYNISPKVNFSEGWMKIPLFRFYGLEHFAGMLIAVILITIGYSKSKEPKPPQKNSSRLKSFI